MTGAAPSSRRLVLLGAGVIIAIALAIGAATILGGPGRQTETGIVVAVDAVSLTEVRGFTIRTSDGRTVDFRIGRLENAATFPPGHIAEHTVSLVPVRVTYVVEGGAEVAVRIEDAR